MSRSSETSRVRNHVISMLVGVGVVVLIWKGVRSLLRSLYVEYGVTNVKDLSHKLVDEYVPMQQRSQVQKFLHEAEDSIDKLQNKVRAPARRVASPQANTAQPSRQTAETPFALNDRQEKIYTHIKQAKQAAMADLSGRIEGVTDRTLRRDLTKLEKLGLVEQVGRTKSSFYRLRL